MVECIVKFYFDPNRLSNKDERLAFARKILAGEGREVDEKRRVLKSGIEEVVLTADIPQSEYQKHHGFDSKLNKTYPDGAEAAEVW